MKFVKMGVSCVLYAHRMNQIDIIDVYVLRVYFMINTFGGFVVVQLYSYFH